METTKDKNDFTKILEKLAAKTLESKQKESKKVEEFDFHNMFIELEKTLKQYQNEHSKKSSESEIKLSELTLTA